MDSSLLWVQALPLALSASVGLVIGWFLHRVFSQRTVLKPTDAKTAGPDVTPTVQVAHLEGPGAPAATSPIQSGPERHPLSLTTTSESHQVEGLDLARRIIVHLSGLGRLANDEVALRGHTQSGMASALAVRQGNLAK